MSETRKFNRNVIEILMRKKLEKYFRNNQGKNYSSKLVLLRVEVACWLSYS